MKSLPAPDRHNRDTSGRADVSPGIARIKLIINDEHIALIRRTKRMLAEHDPDYLPDAQRLVVGR